jgi:hypothetical protein
VIAAISDVIRSAVSLEDSATLVYSVVASTPWIAAANTGASTAPNSTSDLRFSLKKPVVPQRKVDASDSASQLSVLDSAIRSAAQGAVSPGYRWNGW